MTSTNISQKTHESQQSSSASWSGTSQCGVALVLDEEELAPVCARRLHAKHHQVRAGEEPQVGRQQELGQGALISGGT